VTFFTEIAGTEKKLFAKINKNLPLNPRGCIIIISPKKVAAGDANIKFGLFALLAIFAAVCFIHLTL
jgi:hypothetical protein